MCIVHCTVQFRGYSFLCAVCIVQYGVVCIIQFTQFSAQSTACNIMCSLCNLHCVMYCVQCAVQTVFSVHFVVFSVCNMYCAVLMQNSEAISKLQLA